MSRNGPTRFAIADARTVFDGWGKLVLVSLRAPDGRVLTRQVHDHGSGVCVLPYDGTRGVAMLVSQFRAAMAFSGSKEPFIVEVPGGRLDSADPAACARRETLEEAGLRLGVLDFVAEFWVAPGGFTERLSLFLAPYSASDRIGAGGGLAAEDEEVVAHEMPLAELAHMADRGELVDLKTFAAVQTLRLRRPELFA